MQQNTIAAVATPLGAGGVGVVRLSGPDAVLVAGYIFHPVSGKPLESLGGYRGLLGKVLRDGQMLDEAIAFVYRAPKSYTGEDVVEISCHGGVAVVQEVLRLCLENGARMAQPGEFTRRAFLNGKLDLSQAEAVMDIVGAQGEAGIRAAAAARDGAMSRAVENITGRLAAISGHLAAWVDYPEEDMPEVGQTALQGELLAVSRELNTLLMGYEQGRILREGIPTVLAGKPNVGKSTLMNLLAGQQKSIVTEIPGTTRDVVEDSIRLGELVLHLADTAGIRDTDNPVETAGVALARDRVQTAQLVLAVFDGSRPLDEEDYALLSLLEEKRAIGVVNKSDLPLVLNLEDLRDRMENIVVLSALDNSGRQSLEQAVRCLFHMEHFDPGAAHAANLRQRQCLTEAKRQAGEALEALNTGYTLDAVGVCIDCALDSLLSLTGQRATERVVDEVFSRFCVGK